MTNLNLTERKQAEEALREREARLRAIAEGGGIIPYKKFPRSSSNDFFRPL